MEGDPMFMDWKTVTMFILSGVIDRFIGIPTDDILHRNRKNLLENLHRSQKKKQRLRINQHSKEQHGRHREGQGNRVLRFWRPQTACQLHVQAGTVALAKAQDQPT
jgi:hypothetical protein